MFGADLRLSFGNWYRSAPGTPEDRSICVAHYDGLGRMQKRKWKAVNSVEDLGAQADLFEEQKYELVGDVHGGVEKEKEAAALLIATSNLLGEMNQGERTDVAWEDEPAVRKAYEIYLRLYGEHHVKTSEATLALANRTEVDDDQEFELLQRTLQVRKDLLPANDPKVAEALKFMGRFMHENCHDAKMALPFYQKALAIYEETEDQTRQYIDTCSAMNDVACALEDLERMQQARGFYERAYQRSYEHLGARHTETAAFASNLALTIMDSFDHEVFTAVPLLRLSLKTSEFVLGVENVETNECRQKLGDCLFQVSERP